MNCVPDPLPPHRFPSSVTLLPPSILKTGEPLSPPRTMTAFLFSTHVWHSSTILLPETPVLVQVRMTLPCPQPVVRPTLLTCPLLATPSPVMLNVPAISSEPLLGPVVLAMVPSAKPTPTAPATKFESE